jgi:hypothetical protein
MTPDQAIDNTVCGDLENWMAQRAKSPGHKELSKLMQEYWMSEPEREG